MTSYKSLLCVFLVCVSLLPLASCQSNSTSVPTPLNITRLSIGFMGALTLPNVNAQTAGQPGLLAFQLALDRINKDPTLLPNTVLVGEFVDTKSDPSLSVNGAYDLINGKGIVGIIGEGQSTQSQQIQYVCHRYQISQISFGSSSMDFTTDHAKTYPFFMRPVPHVGLEATSLTYFIASQGWTKIAIAFTTDSFGSSGSVATSKAAKSLGISVLVSSSWNVGSTDLSFQVNQLIESKARIFVYWGVINDLLPLWRLAATMTPNILGDGYQWLSGHSVVVPQLYTNATGSAVPDILQYSQGLIGTQYAVNWTAPEGVRMWNAWQAAAAVNTNPLLTSIDKAPTNPAAAISTYASFAYDSTMLMALGLHDMIYRQGRDPRLLANRQQLYNTLLNMTFTGVTGNIHLNSIGDRGEAPFYINNLNSNTNAWQTVAEVAIDNTVTFRQDVSIQYHGANPSLQPLDAPLRPVITVSTTVTTALQLATSIIIFIVGVLTVFVFATRGRPVMKSASPSFLLLLLLGIMTLCSSIYPRTIEASSNHSNSVCIADLFLTNLGYYLLVGSLLVKTFRLKQIFLAKTLTMNTSLSDRQLLLALLGLVVGEGVMLLVLSLTVPMKVDLHQFDSDSDYYRCTAVSDQNLVTYYLPVTISFRFVLLIVTAYVSYTVRNINSLFNESRQLLGTIYNLLFCSILLPAIDAAMDRGKQNTLIAYAACVFLICVATTIIMFYSKVKSVFTNHVDSNYVTSATSAFTMVSQGAKVGLAPVRRASSIAAGEEGQRRVSTAPLSCKVQKSPSLSSPAPRPLPVHNNPKRSPSASQAPLETRKSTPNSSNLHTLLSSPLSSGRTTAMSGEIVNRPSASPSIVLAVDHSEVSTKSSSLRVHMHPQMLADFLQFREAQQSQRTQSFLDVQPTPLVSPSAHEPQSPTAAALEPDSIDIRTNSPTPDDDPTKCDRLNSVS